MVHKKVLPALAAAMLLAGCGGNFESIFRTTESEKFNVSFVDAKQRGIMVTKVNAIKKWNGVDTTVQEVRACAEPSPDVLASVAASFAASANVPDKVAAEFAGAVTGSAASIGLRTQSIQLMRDALYRVCEAYAAGAIDGFQMRTLQIRYQNMIVGLLAIEQLTGAVRGPTATTGGTAAGGTASDAVAISKQLEAIAARRKTLTAELETRKKAETDAQAERDKAKAPVDAATAAGNNPTDDQNKKLAETEDALKTATAARAAAESELADNATQREGLLAALERSKTASASTTSTATSTLPPEPLKPETAEKVAQAVQNIVKDVINQDNTLEGCIELMAALISRQSPQDDTNRAVLSFCEVKLKTEGAKLSFLLQEFGGDKLRRLSAIFADPAKRSKAMAAFPITKPGNIDMTPQAYAGLLAKLKQAKTDNQFHSVFTSLLKKSGAPRDLQNIDAALDNVQAQING